MTQQLNKLGKDRTTGEVVFIRNASNGLSCDCICEKCGERFEAVQGPVNEWHFRHYKETNCQGGQETLLHKLAKQFIADSFEIILPHYETVSYDQSVQEKYFHSIQPDVTAVTNGQNLFFEILVTHPVGEAKEEFYKKGEHKSIEIDLRNYLFTTPEKLRDEVLNNIYNKRLIFWEKVNVDVKSNDNYLWYLLLIFLAWLGYKLLISPSKRNHR